MAYVSQELKKELAPKIKEILKKFKMKGSISVRHHSTLVVTIKSGVLDLLDDTNDSYSSVNVYHIDSHFKNENKKFLSELLEAMMIGNHNRSDIMSDYFDVGWYTDIEIGKWDKPYIFEGSK